ncbi:VOC family protein [uncultured Roseobacter sp.]|uniref:VOC family protein n=1 Tax=uncultured Roseobacter sp. TaxID=114847 RepID=UPI002639CFF0|nr:VOC family protein [uncultured Roseobacter sp.]
MVDFDHIAIAGETLEEAREHAEAALGMSLQPGGQHDVFSTHNALLGLEDGLYLEVIAIDPDAPTPSRTRWFDLDRFVGPARLTNWICRSDNMLEELEKLPDQMGNPVALQRGDLQWRMSVPDDGILPFDNCAPALIQWDTSLHPAKMLPASGVRLRRLTVQHPDAEAINNLFAPMLQDDRVSYETGEKGLVAEFDTPHGVRMIA